MIAILGAVTLAGGLVITGLLAWTDLDLATVIVYGFLAMFTVMAGVAVLGAVLAVREDRRPAREHEQVGDDAIALVKPAPLSDPSLTPKQITEVVDQMMRDIDRGNRG